MTDIQKDVNPADSSAVALDTVEQDVKETVSSPVESSETTQPEQAVKLPVSDDVDDKGVAWKNREAEIRRKLLDELTPTIQNTIEQALTKQLQSQTQAQSQSPEPKYTVQDLISLKKTNPEYSDWADMEIVKLTEDSATKRAMKEFEKKQSEVTNRQIEQQAISNVISNYPNAYNSQFNSWNISDPLYQRAMQIYASNPAFRTPGGLEVAFDKAYAEQVRGSQISLLKKEQKLTSKEKRAEKVTSQAINSGGQASPAQQTSSTSTLTKLMSDYKKTGDRKILTEILKLKGAMHPDLME